MFINEEKLFELKYQLGGKFYGVTLAEIFFNKFNEFSKSGEEFEIINSIRNFYHAFIDENLCNVKFSDNSFILIEKHNGKWSYVKIFGGSYGIQLAEYKHR